jgi:hypothetical protein
MILTLPMYPNFCNLTLLPKLARRGLRSVAVMIVKIGFMKNHHRNGVIIFHAMGGRRSIYNFKGAKRIISVND